MLEWLDRVENRGIAKGMAEGMTKGEIKGAEEQARKTALNLRRMGLSLTDIARAIDRSLNVVQQWLSTEMA